MAAKLKLKKGDLVQMIVGKDKGKKGKIIKVIPNDYKVIVEGLNIIRKHRRPRKAGEKGEIVQVPRATGISNVMLVCPKCGALTRVGYKVDGETKTRICKKCGSEL